MAAIASSTAAQDRNAFIFLTPFVAVSIRGIRFRSRYAISMRPDGRAQSFARFLPKRFGAHAILPEPQTATEYFVPIELGRMGF
jgi:hypothetical protein